MVQFTPVDEQEPTQLPRMIVTPEGPQAPRPDHVTFTPVGPPEHEPNPTIVGGLGQLSGSMAEPGLRLLYDAAGGFNNVLAHALGAPVNAVDGILRELGSDGFLDQPGSAVDAIKRKAHSMGINTGGVDNLAENIGEATFQTTAMLAMMFAMAPLAAGTAASQTSATINAIRSMGSEMLARPGAAVATELGATAGAEMGAAAVPDRYAGLGALLGGFAGGTAGLDLSTRGPKTPGSRLRRNRAGLAPEPAAQPVAPVNETNFSDISTAIAGDQRRIERKIDRIIAQADGSDAVADADKFRGALRNAYDTARNIETDYWSKVNTRLPFDTQASKQFAQTMLRSVSERSLRGDILPGRLLNIIRKWPQRVTLKRMREVQSIVGKELQELNLDPTRSPNDPMRMSLSKLFGHLNDEIARQHPENYELQQARAFSTWLHDRFTRGPVARFAQPRSPDSALRDAGREAQTFVRGERAGTETADIASGAGSPAVDQTAGQFIRSQFTEIAQADPSKGQKWLDSAPIKRFMQAYPQLASNMDQIKTTLSRALEDQQAAQRSGFVKVVRDQPQTTVARLFTSGNKVSEARDIVRRMRFSPAGKRALQDATITHIIGQAKLDPTEALRMLDARDTRAMVQEILTRDQFARMERIFRQAEAVAHGGEKGTTRLWRQTAGRAASILGATVGRWFKTGTIQVPGQTAEIARSFASDLFRTWSPEELVWFAIRDPKWERFLAGRLPENVAEWQRSMRQLRGLAAGMEAQEQQLERQTNER